MTDHLFVYGTLLSGLASPTLAGLMARLTFVGPATTAGELFDLGPYPAAVPDPAKASAVCGELYALPADPTTLSLLDNYEGHFADRPSQSLFRRTRVTVTRPDGGTCLAWMYAWNRPLTDARRIVDGDYRVGRRRVTG